MTGADMDVLCVLDGAGGFTTGDVAKRVSFRFGHNKRTHSAAVRAILLGLERQGLVKRMDDQTPVCWVLSSKGEKG